MRVTAVSRIVRLRHPGVLRNFTWATHLPTFGRYNLIYGWNGSGKTTLSKMFRALEMRTAPSIGDVTISIAGANLSGEDFPSATLPVRVFNRDFVVESVFPIGAEGVPPILVVGKDSVEKQKEVEQLKKKLADAAAALESERSKKRDAEKAVDQHCIDRASVIRDTLRSSGANPYNNYDKARYRTRAKEMAGAGDATAHRCSESDRDRLLAQHRATPKSKVQEISYQPPNLATLAQAVARLLEETVASAAIQALKDDPILSSWVHQGLGLHQARHADSCLFCEQSVPSGRLAALEAHFSADYAKFLKRLDAQIC